MQSTLTTPFSLGKSRILSTDTLLILFEDQIYTDLLKDGINIVPRRPPTLRNSLSPTFLIQAQYSQPHGFASRATTAVVALVVLAANILLRAVWFVSTHLRGNIKYGPFIFATQNMWCILLLVKYAMGNI